MYGILWRSVTTSFCDNTHKTIQNITLEHVLENSSPLGYRGHTSNSMPTLISLGKQRTTPTNMDRFWSWFSRWEPQNVTSARRNHSLMTCTSKYEWAITQRVHKSPKTTWKSYMYGSILGMWHLYVYGLFISSCSLHCLEALKVNVDSTTRRDLHAMSDRLHDNIHWRNERYICMQQLLPLAMGAQNILSLLYTHDSIMNTWLNDKHGQEGFVVYECTFIHPC
jgi:hypothetical protein